MTRSVLSSFYKLGAAALVALSLFMTLAPAANAAGSIEISGWIPYWATAAGTADADAHLSQVTEVNPFGYTVKADGTLYDAMDLSNGSWQSLIRDAHGRGVRVVPTVMWSDTDTIYAILSNPASRATHIQSIVQAVQQNGFDGIDIDYEAKSAETRPYFSSFLSELSTALYQSNGSNELDCTIEARMPLAARYSGTPPANIEYANDLPTINQVCDRVRLMTYDQRTADLQLNAAHSNELYAPVSDSAWVEKVVNYMSSDISKNKMLIGVSTYGAEYQAMSDPDGHGFTYTHLSAFNPQYAVSLAQQLGITPTRNSAGELSFSYVDPNQTSQLPSQSTLSGYAPSGTASANMAAAGALAYSQQTGRQAPVTFVTWSDAQAIQSKVQLAQRLGVAGVAIFKFDGGEDPAMWNSIAAAASPIMKPQLSRQTGSSSSASANSNSSSTSSASTTTTVPNTNTTGCTSTTAYSPITGAKCPVVAPAPTTSTTQTPGTTTTTTTTTTTPPASSTPATSSFTKDLKYGMSGADVTRLQGILIKKGYLKVAANGIFGPATRAAVIKWQKAVGLPATGFFGSMSRAKIGS